MNRVKFDRALIKKALELNLTTASQLAQYIKEQNGYDNQKNREWKDNSNIKISIVTLPNIAESNYR